MKTFHIFFDWRTQCHLGRLAILLDVVEHHFDVRHARFRTDLADHGPVGYHPGLNVQDELLLSVMRQGYMLFVCQRHGQFRICNEFSRRGDLVAGLVIECDRGEPLGKKCLRRTLEYPERCGIGFITIDTLHLLDENRTGGDNSRVVNLAVDGIDEVLHAHLQRKLEASTENILRLALHDDIYQYAGT